MELTTVYPRTVNRKTVLAEKGKSHGDGHDGISHRPGQAERAAGAALLETRPPVADRAPSHSVRADRRG